MSAFFIKGIPSSDSATGSASQLAILSFVVCHVFATPDLCHPFRMFLVPANGLLQTDFKAHARSPAELLLDLAAIDGIPAIMTGAILDIANERAWLAEYVEQGVGQS